MISHPLTTQSLVTSLCGRNIARLTRAVLMVFVSLAEHGPHGAATTVLDTAFQCYCPAFVVFHVLGATMFGPQPLLSNYVWSLVSNAAQEPTIFCIVVQQSPIVPCLSNHKPLLEILLLSNRMRSHCCPATDTFLHSSSIIT